MGKIFFDKKKHFQSRGDQRQIFKKIWSKKFFFRKLFTTVKKCIFIKFGWNFFLPFWSVRPQAPQPKKWSSSNHQTGTKRIKYISDQEKFKFESFKSWKKFNSSRTIQVASFWNKNNINDVDWGFFSFTYFLAHISEEVQWTVWGRIFFFGSMLPVGWVLLVQFTPEIADLHFLVSRNTSGSSQTVLMPNLINWATVSFFSSWFINNKKPWKSQNRMKKLKSTIWRLLESWETSGHQKILGGEQVELFMGIYKAFQSQ